MKQYLSVVLSLLFLTASALSAQSFDLEGFVVDKPLTKAQIIQKFGEPDQYDSYEGMDEGSIGEYFRYGRNYLKLDNNILTDFFVCDTAMATLTVDVPGGIKVGMPLTSLDDTVFGPAITRTYTNYEGVLVTLIYVGTDDWRLEFEVSDTGLIESISFTYPV